MHYDCVNGSHGLPHDPFKAIVAPRPIGWIGSKGKSGVQNLAPYSYFNAVADKPHFVMFSSVGIKDSVKNIEEGLEVIVEIRNYYLENLLQKDVVKLLS